jgi:hypothetical protein
LILSAARATTDRFFPPSRLILIAPHLPDEVSTFILFLSMMLPGPLPILPAVVPGASNIFFPQGNWPLVLAMDRCLSIGIKN